MDALGHRKEAIELRSSEEAAAERFRSLLLQDDVTIRDALFGGSSRLRAFESIGSTTGDVVP